MNKRHLFTIINLSALVFACILWVLSVADIEALNSFSFAWASFIVTGVWAISFTVRVFVDKQVVIKNLWVILAVVFYLTAIGSLIGALVIPTKLILPIICLALASSVLIASLVLGGKRWDQGDNQKEGYKNYYERKAEKEANKTDEK